MSLMPATVWQIFNKKLIHILTQETEIVKIDLKNSWNQITEILIILSGTIVRLPKLAQKHIANVTGLLVNIDTNLKWIRQKFYQFFINDEIPKEFWKNSHFQKLIVGFLLRCQNWLRWYTPQKMHFQELLIFIFTNTACLIVIVLTKCSLCCI